MSSLLTQAEADALLAIEKHRTSADRLRLPGGAGPMVSMTSADGSKSFYINSITPTLKFAGKTGFVHSFVFVISNSRATPEPNTIEIEREKRKTALNLISAWYDTRYSRSAKARRSAFLNDDGEVTGANVTDALANSGTMPLAWSRRNQSCERLVA